MGEAAAGTATALGLRSSLVPGIPAHRQITSILETRIHNGVYKRGDLIPSESRLCREFGVSRITVRQACGDLVARGLLVRHQGRGTSVALSYQPFGPPASSGYLEDILVFFAATTRERLERDVGVASEEIARQLKVRVGTQVAVFSSWRSVDGKPFCFSKTYVRLDLANQISDQNLIDASLVELLDYQLGARMSGARQLLWATAADEAVALELDVPPGAPVLALGLTYYTADGEPAFYTHSLFRGDRYVHHVRLGRLPM